MIVCVNSVYIVASTHASSCASEVNPSRLSITLPPPLSCPSSSPPPPRPPPPPVRLQLKAFEGIVLARAGVFCDMGLNRTLMGITTSYSPLPLASTYGSIVGAMGVTLALLGREATGEGDTLEVRTY